MGAIYTPENSAVIALTRNDKYIAAAVIYEFIGNSCQIQVAGIKYWAKREFVKTVFSACFDQLKVKKVLALIDSENSKSIKLAKHCGMIEESIVKDAGRYADLCIYSMTREQCRYL